MAVIPACQWLLSLTTADLVLIYIFAGSATTVSLYGAVTGVNLLALTDEGSENETHAVPINNEPENNQSVAPVISGGPTINLPDRNAMLESGHYSEMNYAISS